jgi:hypothetical protein
VIGTGSPGKGAKTDQNVWPLPRFNNFHQHECFDDSRFCQIFSFCGNYEISVETILVETNIFWWKLILVETISVETIFLVETIFQWKSSK